MTAHICNHREARSSGEWVCALPAGPHDVLADGRVRHLYRKAGAR